LFPVAASDRRPGRQDFDYERKLMAMQTEKIALFIDGANLYATAKSLGFDIDYKRLLREFQSRGYLLRAFYYTAVIEDQEYSSIRPLIDWLDYNGYTVVTKATKEFVDHPRNRPWLPTSCAGRPMSFSTSSSCSRKSGATRRSGPSGHRASRGSRGIHRSSCSGAPLRSGSAPTTISTTNRTGDRQCRTQAANQGETARAVRVSWPFVKPGAHASRNGSMRRSPPSVRSMPGS
jgi:uncharacterized LabA/DUF88 family protein